MKAFLLSLFLNVLLIGSVFSQDHSKVATSNLNLRQSPDSKGDIINIIPKGTVVSIQDDCDCDWIPVLYKGERVQTPTSYDSPPLREQLHYVVMEPIVLAKVDVVPARAMVV
jgi:hypothetical protein